MKFGPALVLSLALGFALPAAAQQKQVPQSNAEMTLSFAPVVKKAAPAVVNVYASRTEKVQRNPLFDDPVFQQFFGAAPSSPRSQTMRSLGSGVVVDPSGLVVTNYHVIDQMTDVKVALSDQSEYPAQIVLRDQRNDLAVLKIKGEGPFPTMEMGDSDKVEVGDIALAIGDPLRRRPDGDAGHRFGARAHQRGAGRLGVLSADGRVHQSGQFGRRARRHACASRRHQFGDLLAVGRLGRHRLRPSLSTWSRSSSPRRKPATRSCTGHGSAPRCKA